VVMSVLSWLNAAWHSVAHLKGVFPVSVLRGQAMSVKPLMKRL
jgi:hypothetical protein